MVGNSEIIEISIFDFIFQSYFVKFKYLMIRIESQSQIFVEI